MGAKQFGNRLRQLRKQAGATQRELAHKTRLNFTYLSKIETGVFPPPSEKVILQLAEALNADKDELITLAGKVPSDIAQILRSRETLEFKAKLRELRVQAGMTQWQLAAKVNIDPTYLSKIENGVKPPPSEKVVLQLAEVLNVDRYELILLAGKIPSDIAEIMLKNPEALEFLRSDSAKQKARASTKMGLRLIFSLLKDLYRRTRSRRRR